jgi:hypothetical protein
MIAKIVKAYRNEWTSTIKRGLYDEYGKFSEESNVVTGRGDERLGLLADKINEIIEYLNELEKYGKAKRRKK